MSKSETRARLPRGIVPFRGRYRVRMSHDGKTHSLGVYDTITDAKAALNIARADVARGLFVPPAERRAVRKAQGERAAAASMTLRQWSEQWLVALEANPDRSKGTVVAYRSVLKNHIVPQLGEVRLVDLTTELVADHMRPSRACPASGTRGRGRTGSPPTRPSSSARASMRP